jgi:magnesium and cobalt transporter
MMIIGLSLAVMAALIVTSRLAAIYSSQLFSSSSELLTERNDLTDRQRRFIEEINRRPHDLVFTAGLFKSLALVAGSLLTVFLVVNGGVFGGWVTILSAGAGAITFWFVFTLIVDIMPPPSESDTRQVRARLGLLAVIYHGFRPLRRLAGASRARYAEERRDEEKKEEIVERAIETLAEGIGTDEPIIEEDERQMIQQIFRLDTTEVKEVMVPRINIIAVEPETTLDRLREIVRTGGHSRIPVYKGDLDTILGIVHVKDIFCGKPVSREQFDLRKYIRRPLIVPETQKIDRLLEEFRRKRNHLAIVVDEYGGTAGLVSLEDIIEEIVGEIEDEHDYLEPAIVTNDDGTVLVSGQVSLEEITDHFELKPFSEEFETVGGLIYDIVGGVPEPGKVINKPPLRFIVARIDGQRIAEIRVERLPEGNGH